MENGVFAANICIVRSLNVGVWGFQEIRGVDRNCLLIEFIGVEVIRKKSESRGYLPRGGLWLLD